MGPAFKILLIDNLKTFGLNHGKIAGWMAIKERISSREVRLQLY